MKEKFDYTTYALFYFLLIGILLIAVMAADRMIIQTNADSSVLRNCLIIDAGHGGEDGGAVSCTGVYESVINLQIALKLHDLLALLGYDTMLTRTDDGDLHQNGATIAQRKASDLRHRVQIISVAKAPILISIHQNYFADSRYSGAQVFYASTHGSETLAQILQNALSTGMPSASRRLATKSKGVFLMENIQCTGVLIECGFLSNKQEEALLRDHTYQNKICCIIAAGLCDYLDRQEIS